MPYTIDAQKLARGVPMDLDLEFGAVKADIDLAGLALTDLDLSTGASESRVTISEPNPVHMGTASFQAGAAEFRATQLGNLNAERIEVDAGVAHLAYHRTRRGHTVEPQHARAQPLELGREQRDRGAKVAPCEVLQARCRALDDVGETDAIAIEQDLHGGRTRFQRFVEQTRCVQRRPEAVAHERERVPRTHRVGRRVDSDRQHVQVRTHEIR